MSIKSNKYECSLKHLSRSDLIGTARFLLRLYTCFLLYTCLSGVVTWITSFFLFLNTFFIPGPVLASTTWCQSLFELAGSFFHLLTMRTQALQISPFLTSSSLKQPTQSPSYFLLSVNRELGKEKMRKRPTFTLKYKGCQMTFTCLISPYKCSNHPATCRVWVWTNSLSIVIRVLRHLQQKSDCFSLRIETQ